MGVEGEEEHGIVDLLSARSRIVDVFGEEILGGFSSNS